MDIHQHQEDEGVGKKELQETSSSSHVEKRTTAWSFIGRLLFHIVTLGMFLPMKPDTMTEEEFNNFVDSQWYSSHNGGMGPP